MEGIRKLPVLDCSLLRSPLKIVLVVHQSRHPALNLAASSLFLLAVHCAMPTARITSCTRHFACGRQSKRTVASTLCLFWCDVSCISPGQAISPRFLLVQQAFSLNICPPNRRTAVPALQSMRLAQTTAILLEPSPEDCYLRKAWPRALFEGQGQCHATDDIQHWAPNEVGSPCEVRKQSGCKLSGMFSSDFF